MNIFLRFAQTIINDLTNAIGRQAFAQAPDGLVPNAYPSDRLHSLHVHRKRHVIARGFERVDRRLVRVHPGRSLMPAAKRHAPKSLTIVGCNAASKPLLLCLSALITSLSANADIMATVGLEKCPPAVPSIETFATADEADARVMNYSKELDSKFGTKSNDKVYFAYALWSDGTKVHHDMRLKALHELMSQRHTMKAGEKRVREIAVAGKDETDIINKANEIVDEVERELKTIYKDSLDEDGSFLIDARTSEKNTVIIEISRDK